MLHLSTHTSKLLFDLTDLCSIFWTFLGEVVIFESMNLVLRLFDICPEVLDLGHEHILNFSPFVLQLFLTVFDNLHDLVDKLESKSDALDIFIILPLSWVLVEHHQPFNTVIVFIHKRNFFSSLEYFKLLLETNQVLGVVCFDSEIFSS